MAFSKEQCVSRCLGLWPAEEGYASLHAPTQWGRERVGIPSCSHPVVLRLPWEVTGSLKSNLPFPTRSVRTQSLSHVLCSLRLFLHGLNSCSSFSCSHMTWFWFFLSLSWMIWEQRIQNFRQCWPEQNRIEENLHLLGSDSILPSM